MADETVYVKQGRRGVIERAALTPADHVQLQGTGWLPKDHALAPKGKLATDLAEGGDGAVVPTSAAALAAIADDAGGKPATSGGKPKT